eukprot:30938-Pelagococcus_subviridis.AAC.11
MDAPWASSSARRGERGERDDDDDDDGASFSGRIVASGGTVSAPVATLPRPLLLASASDDAPGDVGAHPDTLRALSLVSGDLVALTSTASGECRVARIVAATRWGEATADLDEEEEDDDDDDGRGGALTPGVLYLPPGMRRDLGVHLTEATATASGARPFAAASVRARRVESEDAIPRAGAMTVAALRRPPPSLPSPPTAREDRWVPGGAAEAALGAYFATPRRVAVGDVFAVAADDSDEDSDDDDDDDDDAAAAEAREPFYFVVLSLEPDPPTDDDRRDRRRRRDGVGGVMLASRAWTRCALAPRGAAAGAPPPGLSRFVARGPVGGGGRRVRRPPPPLPTARERGRVAATLAPALCAKASKALRLRTALLLHGSSGVGKRAAAAAAAAALGASFVVASCHLLVSDAGGGAKRLASEIDGAFERAASCAPSVLYLR